MRQTLANAVLEVTADSHGAELQSIKNKRTQHEYLWQGDARFWGRRSPVLFPLVGAVWNGRFRMDGAEFAMGQHGFARDMDFEVMATDAGDEIWFSLDSNEATLAVFPRRFRLEIGYRLQDERLEVMWRVMNRDERTMHFQIGAHPAFNYPQFCADEAVHGYFQTDGHDLTAEVIVEKGCVGADTQAVVTDADGLMPIGGDTFARDALIFGGSRVSRVSMLSKEKEPYLTLLFRSPAVGLWSPSGSSPFVCIEPWWGRCDRVGFEGEFADREYVNHLEPGQTFTAGYMIVVDNV